MKDKSYVLGCLLGDGSLTPIKRKGQIRTMMISITHSQAQLDWLKEKASRLNKIFNRNCVVGVRDQYDDRTDKTYKTCQYSLTSLELMELYPLVYPGGKKTFTEDWLSQLTEEHLAIVWADDGNLEPKTRVGRLNLYECQEQCEIVAKWIEQLTGAVGRYEDYEGQGVGRLRFPASEMVKIAISINPFLTPSMAYKTAMQYKRNNMTKFLLFASSPNVELPEIKDIPEVDAWTKAQWMALGKKCCISDVKNKNKRQLRDIIISKLQQIMDNKGARARNQATLG